MSRLNMAKCQILGSHSDELEVSGLLLCYTVLLGLTGPDVLKKSWVIQEYWVLQESTALKAKALGSFQMLKSVNHATQRNIPEE